MKAQNIFLDENTGGKGRYFKSRFLQPGLVKYSFGVCVLSKETIDKFAQDFVGCPVIINHKDVTNESAKNDRVGVISRVWFDETDGWFWCEGVIFDEKAISLIESGYNVSCQYEITEYSNNTTNALHNGNPYDKVILNGKPEHLAIVETPRYENAMIAVNAIEWEEDDHPRKNDGTFAKKVEKFVPIKIKKEEIPQFESKKELSNWVKSEFEKLGLVKIEDTGIDIQLSSTSADRETIKRRSLKEENKAVFAKFKDIVSSAIKKEEREADERHIKNQEIYYNKFQIDNIDYDVEIFVDKPYKEDKKSYYAGHKASKIKIAPRDSQVVQNNLSLHSKGANNIIPYLELNFNPDVTIYKDIKQAINEIKETNMFRKLFNKKEQKMEKEELKSIFMDCIQDVLKAQNEAEEEKKKADDVENEDDEKDKKVENKCKNDVVDKRDIIRQIMAIAGKEEASEDVKTIAKLAEKLAYDKSEADGKADNCGKKSKNEEDEKEKEEALNKAKNSIEVLKGLLSQGEVQKPTSKYMTKAQAIELGNQLF